MQRGISPTAELGNCCGEPGFSVGKGMAFHNKSLHLHCGSLAKSGVGPGRMAMAPLDHDKWRVILTKIQLHASIKEDRQELFFVELLQIGNIVTPLRVSSNIENTCLLWCPYNEITGRSSSEVHVTLHLVPILLTSLIFLIEGKDAINIDGQK